MARSVAAALLTSLAIILAGCGGDESSGATEADLDASVGSPRECSERLEQTITSDFLAERGIEVEQGAEAIAFIGVRDAIRSTCRFTDPTATLGDTADEVVSFLGGQIDAEDGDETGGADASAPAPAVP